jgi:hypothetical protein
MKRFLCLFLIVFVFAGLGFQEKAFAAASKDKKIVSAACIMAYTDRFSRSVKVIRSEPLTIALK